MLNHGWLLCVIIVGLTARQVASMNEQPHGKNHSSKTRESDVTPVASNISSDGKIKSHDQSLQKESDHSFLASPTTSNGNLTANSTSLNGTIVPVSDVSATSNNVSKVNSHEQIHSKRHFRRSKVYRKETRPKSRPSLAKSNVVKANLIPFGTEHVGVSSQDLLHNSDHNNDLIKLMESSPKISTVSSSKTHVSSISRDNSVPINSSKSLATNGSKNSTLDRKLDELSSGSSENWYSSSSSSESTSVIKEKSSSVELMAFTFDSAEAIRQSTLLNQTAGSSSTAAHRSSSATVATVRISNLSIDSSISGSTPSEIDRGQSIQSSRGSADDDVIYSVHTERSRDISRTTNEMSTSVSKNDDNSTKNDSAVLASVSIEASVPKNSKNMSTNISADLDRSGNESNATNSENNSNHVRRDVDGYSWISVDDSSNRISLTRVLDTLKKLNSQESLRNSYSFTNSTLSQVTTEPSLESKLDSGKHPESLILPKVTQGSSELRPSSTSRSSELKLPVNVSSGSTDYPLKLSVPLNMEAIAKARIANNLIELPGPSETTSRGLHLTNASSEQRVLGYRNEPLMPLVEINPSSSPCSSESLTNQKQQGQKVGSENPFYHRRSADVTLSLPGSSISKSEQCTTRSSSSVEVDGEGNELAEGLNPVRKSHEEEVEKTKLSPFTTDDNRGAQNLSSSNATLPEIVEPIIRESSTSATESIVAIETEGTTTDVDTALNFFAAFGDLDEHCNASSFNVFIPSINSRDIVVRIPIEDPSSLDAKPSELVRRETQNITTEDNLYIMEGFGLFKNNPEDISDLEEEIDHRRAAPFDYGETETYPGYPQVDGHILPALKVMDQIEFEGEIPVKQEPLIPDFQWKGDFGERKEDLWWLNDETKQTRESVKTDDTEQKTIPKPEEYPGLKEVRAIQYLSRSVLPQIKESNNTAHRIYLLPTIYVLIGICVVVAGCSIWCSKIPITKKRNMPKLKYFVEQEQKTREAVV